MGDEVALAAVTQNGDALKHASVALQNDKHVVLAAVAQCGRALQYASVELQNDKEVVLAAVVQHGLALQYASWELRRDKLLLALSDRQTCAGRRWYLALVKVRARELAAWWCKEAAGDDAHFDAEGQAHMTGHGAKRAREDFARMGCAL